MLKRFLSILALGLLPYGASAAPLWTESEMRADCKKTWGDNRFGGIDSCVITTKELFTGPVEKTLEKFDTTKEPLSGILASCQKDKSGGVRFFSGCIDSLIKPIRLFLPHKPEAFDWGDGLRRALTSQEEEGIKSALSAKLKDPDSAKFALGQYNGSAVYCGMVNAKNSYGGYSGFQTFIIEVLKTSGGFQAGSFFVIGDQADEACTTFRY